MTTVVLITGEQVDSASEEWREECEARAIANRSIADRRMYLFEVGKSRGAEAEQRLKNVLQAIWAARTKVSQPG